MTKRHDYQFIQNTFAIQGYKLLSKEYINAHTKLEYICPKGHKHKITWNHWREGHKCPYCAGQGKPTINDIKQMFNKEGYILLTDRYINASQKLKYICPNKHVGTVRLSNWNNRNTRCMKCSAQERATKYHRKPFDEVLESFEKAGYKLLSKSYRNCEQKLKCICNNGHEYKVTWHDWNSGIRCPKCFDGSSKWEKEVKSFIDELGIDYVPNDRNILINPSTKTPLELDIWMPQINKAIECNGEYWHSFNKRKKIDKIKAKLCEKLGIDILVIGYEEWHNDIKSCKNKILQFIEVKQ